MQGSEVVLDAELNDARAAQRRPGLGGDATERPRVEDEEVRLRIAPVEVVQQVECLEAKLEPLSRAHREQPRHGEVDVPVMRPDHGITRKVAEGTGAG